LNRSRTPQKKTKKKQPEAKLTKQPKQKLNKKKTKKNLYNYKVCQPALYGITKNQG
jgi:hypothetical protein